MVKIPLNNDKGIQLAIPQVIKHVNSVANKSVSDSDSDSVSDSVSDKHAALQRFLDSEEKENDVGINTYSPGKRKTKYFRLSYRQKTKIKHIHIPGGNIQAKLAQYQAGKLQEMIDCGAELEEIIAAVKTYKSGRSSKKNQVKAELR